MSNSLFAADCRDTWQYRQVCSQRSVTTKMWSPVESGRRRIRVRSLMASSSAGSVSPGTWMRCAARSRASRSWSAQVPSATPTSSSGVTNTCSPTRLVRTTESAPGRWKRIGSSCQPCGGSVVAARSNLIALITSQYRLLHRFDQAGPRERQREDQVPQRLGLLRDPHPQDLIVHLRAGYVFMDYVDEFAITDIALFSARYGYLAQWNLDVLLEQLAGRPVTVAALRAEFRALLEACRDEGELGW